ATPRFLRANSPPEADYQHVATVRWIMGLGVAFFFLPILSILLSARPPHRLADASGRATCLRPRGGSFAASVTPWIWNRRATQHHAYLSENISLYDPATHETLAQLGGNTQANAALLDRMVQSQAYMMSTIDYFTMLGWLFLAL
ncbi:MFS transporter, partial [Pseudomonas aeruginosa]|nr:MFS transporter [Pseudomonas aeruginosa]